MRKPLKRVLLTNDDGWRGEGLILLEQIAATLAEEVWVVAPELDQSGMSMAVSLHEPLRVQTYGERRFSVSGTPSDCVLLAVEYLLPEPPELVLSGINRGSNFSDSVAYSGTVGAALSANLLGLPALALSQAFRPGEPVPWQTAERYSAGLIQELLRESLPTDTAISINFPARAPEDVSGVSLCRPARGSLTGVRVEARRDTRDLPYYWIGFRRDPQRVQAPDSDVAALRAGRIAISPLRLERDIDRQWRPDTAALAQVLGLNANQE